MKSKLIAVNPFLGMAADIKLPKGRGDDADINPCAPEERDLNYRIIDRSLALKHQARSRFPIG